MSAPSVDLPRGARRAAAGRRTGPLLPLSPRVRAIGGEVLVVVVLLALPQLLVLSGFYRGDISPQFDFLGSYSTEAFAWWRDGGFFDPPQWMPYTWGGYPSATALQSSSWYLPVGIPAELTDYSVRVAAVVQALHVVGGALGTYLLVRLMGLGRTAASVALVAASFAAGYFANAQHVDIVRGYAWAPWVLLLTSPFWPWRRWWSVPAAVFLLWQAIVGIYPGMVVSFVYMGLVWLIAHQVWGKYRLTAYVVPVGVTVLLAGLLSCLKFLPALMVRQSEGPVGVDQSVFGVGILGTVFFPYDGENLPTDMSMRSYFVPATCVALLALVPWRDLRARAAALTATACLVVSLPLWPWFRVLGELPGFDLSRFRFSDYRPVLLTCVVLLAALGLSDALRRDAQRRALEPGAVLTWRRWPVLVVLGAILLVAAGLGVAGGFTAPRWSAPWTILLTSCIVVAGIAALGDRRWRVAAPDGRVLAAVLVGLTLVSGTDWAFSTTRPWRAERVVAETETWGATSDVLIALRSDPRFEAQSAVLPGERRPARTPLSVDPVPPLESQRPWNVAYYTGVAAVGGYTNLKGNDAYESAMAAFQDPTTTTAARALYAAPGLVLAAPDAGVPDEEALAACADTGDCGAGLHVEAAGYAPGHLTYDVSSPGGPVLLNEAYYDGWAAQACDADGACRAVPLSLGAAGTTQAELPPGEYTLDMQYTTPGLSTAWTLFWAGVAGTAAWAAVAALLGSRRRSRRDRTGERTASSPGAAGRAPEGVAP